MIYYYFNDIVLSENVKARRRVRSLWERGPWRPWDDGGRHGQSMPVRSRFASFTLAKKKHNKKPQLNTPPPMHAMIPTSAPWYSWAGNGCPTPQHHDRHCVIKFSQVIYDFRRDWPHRKNHKFMVKPRIHSTPQGTQFCRVEEQRAPHPMLNSPPILSQGR